MTIRISSARDVAGTGVAAVDAAHVAARCRARRAASATRSGPSVGVCCRTIGASLTRRIIAQAGGGASIKIVSPEIGCRKRTDARVQPQPASPAAASRSARRRTRRRPRCGSPAAARCARTWCARPACSRTRTQRRRARAARRPPTRCAAASGCRPPPTRTRPPRRPDAPDGRRLDAARPAARPPPRPGRSSRSRRRVSAARSAGQTRGAARRDQHAAGPGVQAVDRGRPRADRATRPRTRGSARRCAFAAVPRSPGAQRMRRHAGRLGDRDQRLVVVAARRPRRADRARSAARAGACRAASAASSISTVCPRERAAAPLRGAPPVDAHARPPASRRRAAATLRPGTAAATT